MKCPPVLPNGHSQVPNSALQLPRASQPAGQGRFTSRQACSNCAAQPCSSSNTSSVDSDAARSDLIGANCKLFSSAGPFCGLLRAGVGVCAVHTSYPSPLYSGSHHLCQTEEVFSAWLLCSASSNIKASLTKVSQRFNADHHRNLLATPCSQHERPCHIPDVQGINNEKDSDQVHIGMSERFAACCTIKGKCLPIAGVWACPCS